MKKLAAALAGALLALPALAQQPEDDDPKLRGSLGAGIGSRPEYPGSDRRKTRIAPLFSLSYGRFFIGGDPEGGGGGGSAGIGYNAYRSGGWRLGGTLGYDFRSPREESDDDRLRGLGDIDRTLRAGLFASYSRDWFTLRGNVSTDIGGKDQGTLVRLDALGRLPVSERLFLSAGPGLTWGSGDREQTFFGINAEQALRSGRPQYSAGSGIESLRFSVGARYIVDRQWSIGASFALVQLQGDAANSPITQSRSQNTYGLFGSYRF